MGITMRTAQDTLQDKLSASGPPDWMQFTQTKAVQWRDIEAMVEQCAAEVAARFTLLVAVLRAGSPVAALLSRKTGLPLDYLLCNRINPRPRFIDGEARAPRGEKILLIDDVCGSGWTFSRAQRYCESLDNSAHCLSVYYCDAPDMFRPDFGLPMGSETYLRWPWEYQIETEMPAGTRSA
jgi:hypothetical protein